MKNHFDISGSIGIREVDIAGVACIFLIGLMQTYLKHVIMRYLYSSDFHFVMFTRYYRVNNIL